MSGARNPAGRALRWWAGALMSALAPAPDPFARGAVRLRPEGGGYTVLGAEGAPARHLARAVPDRAVLAAVRRARQRFLDLDDDAVLVVDAALPAAAEAEPAEAVGLRMPELTPFSEEEVLFDLDKPRPLGTDRIGVRAFVTPRAVIEQHRDALARLGVRLDGVIASETAEVTGCGIPDFMPGLARRRATRRAVALGAALALFAGSLGWLGLVAAERQERIREARLAAVAELIENLREASALEQEISELSVALVSPRSRRAREVSPLEVLDDLAKALPDDIYLDSFSFGDGEVAAEGFAPDATVVIGLLEASPILAGVRFEAPTARNARERLDRFSVSARSVAAGDGR